MAKASCTHNGGESLESPSETMGFTLSILKEKKETDAGVLISNIPGRQPYLIALCFVLTMAVFLGWLTKPS